MKLFVAVALISLGIQTEALYHGLFQSGLYGAGLLGGNPGLFGGPDGNFPGDLRLITEPTSGLPLSEAAYVGLVRQRLVPAPYNIPRPVPVGVPHPVPQPFPVDVPIPQPFQVPVPQPVPIHTLTEVTDTAVIRPFTTAYVTQHGPIINQAQIQLPFVLY